MTSSDDSPAVRRDRLTVAEYLAIPYRLRAYAHETPSGEWKRAAAYPEIGCVAYADTLLEAMTLLEEQRKSFILERLDRPDEIPVPRPPIRWVVETLGRGDDLTDSHS